MTDGEKQLRVEYRQLQEKRTYFLLAASGTSIGFTITQLDQVPVSSTLYFAVMALTLFGASFFSGVKLLSFEEKLIDTNSRYLSAITEFEAKGISQKQFREIVNEASFNPLAKKKLFWMRSQVWTLFIGAMLLPLWKLSACSACVEVLLPEFLK